MSDVSHRHIRTDDTVIVSYRQGHKVFAGSYVAVGGVWPGVGVAITLAFS